MIILYIYKKTLNSDINKFIKTQTKMEPLPKLKQIVKNNMRRLH
jgi:hypothetical protein